MQINRGSSLAYEHLISPPRSCDIAIITVILIIIGIIVNPVLGGEETGIPEQIFTPYISDKQVLVYSLDRLSRGEILHVSAEPESGNLDPLIALVPASFQYDRFADLYQSEITRARENGEDQVRAGAGAAEQHFLAWDDDSGSGYSSNLEYPVQEAGNYSLLVLGNLMTENQGYCRVRIGITKGPLLSPSHGYFPHIYRNTSVFHEDKRVQNVNGTLMQGELVQYYILNPVRSNDTLFLSASSGTGEPFLVKLRDFGGKTLATAEYRRNSGNLKLEYTFHEPGTNLRLDFLPVAGQVSAIEIPFHLVIGMNTPSVLTGDAEDQGVPVLQLAKPVLIGVELDQITDVNQKGENFAIVGNIWMQWSDPSLAFDPHSCNCSRKIYRSIEEFTRAEGQLWPDFTIYNQQERRWTQNTQIRVFPDGDVTYYERFWDRLQAPDFDFKKYPFDSQDFYVKIDSLYPQDLYQFVSWPEKTRVGDQLGEEEWIITSSDTSISTVYLSDDNSRYSFHVTAIRHIQYYFFRIIVPILIIILLTYISFLLSDYGKRADIASANLLILVAYNFLIGDDIPRVGYLTFLDIILILSFVITGMTVVYNFYLKWMADVKAKNITDRIDRIMVWLYPVVYLVSLLLLLVIGEMT